MVLSSDVCAMVQAGRSVRINYGKDNSSNEVRHIRTIVDDEFVVYRVWSYHKKRWKYKVEWIGGFQVEYDSGILEAVKP